jgi:hypothetical protein
MKLTEVLTQEANGMYAATEKLIKMVEPSEMSWKPSSGKNWMTTAQLLRHCADACGAPIKGFVSGDWGLPAGMKMEDISPEDMLPPAEKLASVATVDEALKILAEDRKTALKYIGEAGEETLLSKKSAAPWGGPEVTLYQHLSSMIQHLGQHKAQLYYYLKLMGKDVNTTHLWGM